MALGTNQITTTTAAKFIPDVWSMEVLRATEDALVMAPLVKRYDSLVKERGDTIHIPSLSNLTANDKSANTQVTLQAVTETETTIDINKHKEASFLVEDIVKVQSNYDLSKIGSFYRKVIEKVREFGGHLARIARQYRAELSFQIEGVQTMYGLPFMGKDIVGTVR
jgi:hypothetical protein